MPFRLYQTKTLDDGTINFQNKGEFPLGAKKGPIANLVRRSKDEKAKVFKWHMSESDLMAEYEIPSLEAHSLAIVIDLKPNKPAEFYQIREIWGYSYDVWTPVALHLEELELEASGKSPQEIRDNFIATGYKNAPIFEFLYLKGGLKKDSWGWGPVGSVNGALLWPDAFRYFLRDITKILKD